MAIVWGSIEASSMWGGVRGEIEVRVLSEQAGEYLESESSSEEQRDSSGNTALVDKR